MKKASINLDLVPKTEKNLENRLIQSQKICTGTVYNVNEQ